MPRNFGLSHVVPRATTSTRQLASANARTFIQHQTDFQRTDNRLSQRAGEGANVVPVGVEMDLFVIHGCTDTPGSKGMSDQLRGMK